MSATTEKLMRPVHVTNKTAPNVPGRRSFFTYRDLGVTDATQGAMRAQVTEAVTGMTEPTGWHYHVCDTQFVYLLKGWVDLEFETGEQIRVQAGESLLIPGGPAPQRDQHLGRSGASGDFGAGADGNGAVRAPGRVARLALPSPVAAGNRPCGWVPVSGSIRKSCRLVLSFRFLADPA